jgi:O-antigen/teichoic acid export membrane protein
MSRIVEAVEQESTIISELRTAGRHTAVYGLGSVLAKAIGFLMLPFYTHYLSPKDYGLLEILDLSMSLFGMVLHAGISPAMLRSYGMARSDAERRLAASSAFVFAAGTGILSFLAGAPAVPYVSERLFGPGVPSMYLLLSFSSFVFGYIANMPRTYLRAREASATLTTVETVGLVLMLALNIYFIAFRGIGLLGILLSSIIVNGLQAVALSAWMIRDVGLGFARSAAREMASFGLPLILSNVAMFTLNCSDRFFLQRLRSLEVVGVYAIGYKFAFMLNYLLVQPFYVMWQSRMFKVYSNPEHPKIFAQIFAFYSLLLIYAALVLAVLSPELVRVMAGVNFAAAQDVIPVVALAYVFYGIGYYCQLGMFLTSNTRVLGLISIAAAALNLVLNYVLILNFGILGAAWATVLGFAAVAAASQWFSHRALPLPLGIKRVGVAMAIAAGMYFICPGGSQNSVGLTIAIKCCYLALFPAVLWKTGILSPTEIGTLAWAKQRTMAQLSRGLGWVVGR